MASKLVKSIAMAAGLSAVVLTSGCAMIDDGARFILSPLNWADAHILTPAYRTIDPSPTPTYSSESSSSSSSSQSSDEGVTNEEINRRMGKMLQEQAIKEYQKGNIEGAKKAWAIGEYQRDYPAK